MLSRYDKKIIRITLSDGSTISGKAEVLPSGYALDTFGIGKECIRIGDMYIFADDIAKIEILGDEKKRIDHRNKPQHQSQKVRDCPKIP